MGHAYVKNLCEIFMRQLYAKGKVSIREAADFAKNKGEKLHAGEGDYGDDFMIAQGLEDIVAFLLERHSPGNKVAAASIIEPYKMTAEQTEVFNDRFASDGSIDDWDSGEDGFGGKYGVFDSIQWKLTSTWRKHYKDIPVLDHVEN